MLRFHARWWRYAAFHSLTNHDFIRPIIILLSYSQNKNSVSYNAYYFSGEMETIVIITKLRVRTLEPQHYNPFLTCLSSDKEASNGTFLPSSKSGACTQTCLNRAKATLSVCLSVWHPSLALLHKQQSLLLCMLTIKILSIVTSNAFLFDYHQCFLSPMQHMPNQHNNTNH